MKPNPASGAATHWLTRREAAKRLGVSDATFGRMITEGSGPSPITLRRRKLYSEAAVVEFLARQAAEVQWRAVAEPRREHVAAAV